LSFNHPKPTKGFDALSQRVTLVGCSRLVGELFVDWILQHPN